MDEEKVFDGRKECSVNIANLNGQASSDLQVRAWLLGFDTRINQANRIILLFLDHINVNNVDDTLLT